MKRISNNNIVLLMIFLFYGCDTIQFDRYDYEIKNTHPNSIEIDRIINKNLEQTDTLRFAYLTDTHDKYDCLADAVNSINKQNGLLFVVCGGDITDDGLIKQYNRYVDIISECKCPFLNIIGNHDYMKDGQIVFEEIFGSTNSSFILKDYKFIFFDNYIQEDKSCIPQYQWLKNECADSVHYQIILSHAPHWTGSISGYHNIILNDLLKPERTILCLYGHCHQYTEESGYNRLNSIVGADIKAREYYIISLIGEKSMIKRVSF